MTFPQYPYSPDDAWSPRGPAVPRVETLPARSEQEDLVPRAITSGPLSAGAGRSRPGRLLRGPMADPRWARPALLALLALTALLYAAGLSRNGWANDFYSAAVQAGTRSWKAFFFGSFDASSFITVDKTPASLWVMELSARVFGLNYWSVLLPQAAEGVASAALLYAAVRRWSGPAAGLIAAGVLATTPVATLMFRFNNPDALLVLLMTAAAYAMVRAIESGRIRWIMFAGALLGFGFLTKMLQAFLVLPAFALVYLVAGPPGLGRRIRQLLAGGAALLVAAGWWVAVVQFTPAGDRPYVGGSTNDSILQLALGYNGLGRLDGNETGSVGFNGGGTGGGGGSPFGGSTGLGRLFAGEMGGQISWLLPAALIALAALAWLSWRRERTDRVRAAALLWGGWLIVTGLVFSYMSGIIHPYYTVALAPAIGALAGIGAVTAWRARRSMLAGRAMAARVLLAAALALTAWWAYALLGRSAGWLPWLRPLILVCGVAAAAAVIAERWLPGRAVLLSVAPLALVASLAGPLAYSINTAATSHTGALPSAGPSVASGPGGGPGGGFGGARPGGGFGAPGGTTQGGPASGGSASGGSTSAGAAPGSSAQGGTGAPGAGTPGSSGAGAPGSSGAVGAPGSSAAVPGGTSGRPSGSGTGRSGQFRGGKGGGIGGGLGGSTQVSSAITKLLTRGAAGYRWAAATVGAESAAPFQLASGEPVMAIGGFNGTDQAPSLAEFKKMVAAHDVHYFIGANGHTFGGGSGDAAQITSWVEAHFTKQTVGGVTVYNLGRPASS
jgi:4-amino-4-deoxy-L-arabinose transferase-like glycosyltransferase